MPISVNLTSNVIPIWCLMIRARSPLATLNKQGGLIVERLNQGYEGY